MALVPGSVTVDPRTMAILVAGSVPICFRFQSSPSAMDGVCLLGSRQGWSPRRTSCANLEGLQTRYEDPDAVLAEMPPAPPERVTELCNCATRLRVTRASGGHPASSRFALLER